MLIYNHNKEFVGIDEESLRHLGYKSLSGFLEDYSDFADLFVKKPGYIHNFKNFPWIDFVLHADAEESKAIIQTNTASFSCDLVVKPYYLVDSPGEESYTVTLKHIQNLDGSSPAPSAETKEKVVLDMNDDFNFDTFDAQEPTVLSEPDLLDIPDIELPEIDQLQIKESTPQHDMDLSSDFDLSFGDDIPKRSTTVEKPMLGDHLNKNEAAYLQNLQTDKNYIYDPKVASDELGLPVDLIQEFIGDFIQQSYEFKDQLFDAALKEDYNDIHTLSHKLKGVAANLRIEDIFEVLNIINASMEQTEVEANLKQFYYLIEKLDGKNPGELHFDPPVSAAFSEPQENENKEMLSIDDDIYDFDLLLDDDAQPEAASTKETAPDDLEIDFDNIGIKEEPAPEPEIEFEDEEIIIDTKDSINEPPVKHAPEKNTFEEPGVEQPKDTHTAQLQAPTLHYSASTASLELGLNSEFVKELIGEFVEEARSFRPKFDKAFADNNFLIVQNLSIELKGASDNLRIHEISSMLQELLRCNNSASGKKTLDGLYGLIDQL